MRGGWASTILAVLGGLATLATAVAVGTLFSGTAWLPQTAVTVIAVVVVGIAARLIRGGTAVVLGLQVAAAGITLAWVHAPQTLWLGLPSRSTWTAAIELLEQAQHTIATNPAPAPVDPGVAFALALVVGLVAIAVDLAAATARSPVTAGMPLLALYLVPAVNIPDGLHWGYVIVPASLWLAMLAVGGRVEQDRWITAIPVAAGPTGAPEQTSRTRGRQAAQVGVLALAAAIALPALLPHQGATFLTEGLGRGAGSGASGSISLATDLDLRRSLEDPSPRPVIRYQTTNPTPEPLRIGAVVDFVDGRSQVENNPPQMDPNFRIFDTLEPDAPSYRLTVSTNRVRAPQLAAPLNVTDADFDGVAWSIDRQDAVQVDDSVPQYSLDYRVIAPTSAELAAVGRAASPFGANYLALDEGSRSEIEQLSREIVPQGAGPAEAAQAIQAHLRSERYRYSLTLEPSLPGEDPVVAFLRTRVGYCQQFASAMVLLARANDIPARMAVGFLPGTSDGEERVVRASDAHAWPELYFERYGWVRFEPTPGAQAASLPDYSREADDQATDATPTPTAEETTPSPTTSAARPENDPAAVDPAAASADEASPWPGRLMWAAVVLLLLAAAASILPLTALVVRSRRRREQGPPRIEGQWATLVNALADLDVPVPGGATPRRTGETLYRSAGFDDESAVHLQHVVQTLERARYAPPGTDLDGVDDDVHAIVRSVRRRRRLGIKARAALLPTDGIEAWKSLPRVIRGRLNRRP
ncbi:transglutaminaseTgpA domain-containing protein [Janibacter sp. GXQ6167]|uniref:transglutaminase family protein n=1 Tax=Janibacter sp. GXQ6167 TaxID=3240791 RepID=UPI003524DE33